MSNVWTDRRRNPRSREKGASGNRPGEANAWRTIGHQLGHQRSDTAQTEAGSLRMKKLILLNQTTPAQPSWIRTKRGKANFKTGALNHSATLPGYLSERRPKR